MAITNVYAANYKKSLVDQPSVKVRQGEYGGHKKILIDTFTFDGDATSAQAATMGRLPPGALVLAARVFGPDLGGTGTLELGNSASLDGSGTDAADSDSFIDAADSSGQAFDVSDSGASQRGPAIGAIRFQKAVDITLTFVGATSGATGKVVTAIVEYVVD